MMLKQTLPEPVARRLRDELKIDDKAVRLSVASDIDASGAYRAEWLVATDDRVVVLDGEASAPPRVDLAISEATEFRCAAAVGSGALQARVDGAYVDLVRYTNRLSDTMGKTARKLDHRVNGEPIVIHPEDEEDPNRCPSCGMVKSFPGEACPRCVNRGAVLMRMGGLMRPHWAAGAVIMGLLLVGIALDLVAPYLTKILVDDVLPGTSGTQEALGSLLGVVAILALVQVARAVVNMLNGRLGAKVGTALTYDIRGKMVDHLQQLSVGYYDRQQVGSLTGRVAYDTEALHGFVGQLTSGFLFQLLMVIGVGIVMFSLSPQLALFTLIPAPFVILGSILFWKHIYPRYYRFWDASSKQAGMLSGVLSGIRVVKAFSQEKREQARFNKASTYMRDTRRRVDFATSFFNPCMTLVFQAGGWIVWYVGGEAVLEGRMSLGELMAFFGYLWMFYGPLTMLTQFTNWLTQFATQAHRIFEILDTPLEITDQEKPVPIGEVAGEIEFKNVVFGYQRHAPVLRDVSFHIKPGEMIGVVGRSGSGKTTIINLICRFYDVNEGQVLIDGHDIRSLSRAELSNQIGVVLQEPFLFRGAIHDNLIYGAPDATPEDVITASKAANTHDFILRSNHGYDTWVGERGAGLSGGERQRVSIARVLLTKPRILILDEATSSVDAESEVAIQKALAEVVKGRTTIAIAHRLSTLRNANRIMVVDNGRIAEEGSHAELVAKGGLYAHLVHIQGQSAPQTVDDLTEVARHKEQDAKDALAPVPSHHPRWLAPGNCKITTGRLGQMVVELADGEVARGVFAVACFPVKMPGQYISLRTYNEEKREVEVGLVRDIGEFDAQARALLERSLGRRFFVHIVQSIKKIAMVNGYLALKVDTDLGPREFMMRWQGDRAIAYGEDGKMLIDTEENRYLVREISKLPDDERRMFEKFIYW